ncbi:Gamma-interferon-inducible lysosomal thiol reductase [Durusdinium trenchii]|uniref:Gamma-interferon-inducible lysosomal thiol reductase n=1 Tax=Durusdinium trenchii TaxID=1381693 RepID=A0ABP0IDU0_9DINO
MAGIYSVSRLQARLLLHRELHPVWGHERVMIYGSMVSEYMMPDVFTNDPIEVSVPLKFKAAFREDADPYHPTGEAAWNEELERRGLKSEIAEGKQFEELLRKHGDPKMEVPENMFAEAILDNVVDLGELVLQFYGGYMEKQPVSPDTNPQKLGRRLRKRMKKDYGIDSTFELEDNLPPRDPKDKTSKQDYVGAFNRLDPNLKFKSNGL